MKKSADLVNATKFIKEKGDNELPQVISDIANHIDELKTALKTLSSES